MSASAPAQRTASTLLTGDTGRRPPRPASTPAATSTTTPTMVSASCQLIQSASDTSVDGGVMPRPNSSRRNGVAAARSGARNPATVGIGPA